MNSESNNSNHQWLLPPADATTPKIGGWLAALGDCRERTLKAIAGITAADLDRPCPQGGNSIGSLLYHIAAIELDWLYADILEEDFPPGFREWFPRDVRDSDGALTIFTGDDPRRHLERLHYVREKLSRVLGAMLSDEFDRARHLEGYDVTPRWIVHHLLQHEAEHRGQIMNLHRRGPWTQPVKARS